MLAGSQDADTTGSGNRKAICSWSETVIEATSGVLGQPMLEFQLFI